MNPTPQIVSFIGVDVSKAACDFDLCNPTRCRRRLPNTAASLAPWVHSLPTQSHLVVEATGGYERLLVALCQERGLPVSVVNPARVRHFAKAHGRLAKTDTIDAALLRAFGEKCQPVPTPPTDPLQAQLAELVHARDHLVALQTHVLNALEHARSPEVVRAYQSQRQSLKEEIARLEAATAACLQTSATLSARRLLLEQQPGIGPRIAAMLLAYLPELGRANRQQIAALAGLAPHPWDSGTMKGHRHLRGGRPKVRRALYLAALTLSRSTHAPLANFCRRLRTNGKPAKVALLATARKLLLQLNFLFKSNPPIQT